MNKERKQQPEEAPENQGEGDRASAKRYNDAQREFVQSHDVAQAADAAAPDSDQQARELERAEAAGRERAPEASREGDRLGGNEARPDAGGEDARRERSGGVRGDEQTPRRRGRFLRRRR